MQNSSPPSLALLALAMAQIRLLVTAAPRVTRWLRRQRFARTLAIANDNVMMAYFSIGMALHSEGSYEDVFAQLTDGLSWSSNGRSHGFHHRNRLSSTHVHVSAIMGGTGLGAKRGVFFKNAAALETSAGIQVVVMDKIGTLTKGEPEVTDVLTDGVMSEDTLLRLVAAVERESEHPLAEAVVRYAQQRRSPPPARKASMMCPATARSPRSKATASPLAACG